MTKLNIFISSTCKNLHKERFALKDCIESLGHNAIMSESFTFPIDPSKEAIDNCIDIVRDEADIFTRRAGCSVWRCGGFIIRRN